MGDVLEFKQEKRKSKSKELEISEDYEPLADLWNYESEPPVGQWSPWVIRILAVLFILALSFIVL